MSRILEISGLTRRYGDKTALKDVSLSLDKGKILGLIGENGAGKTTLIKHVLGLLKAEEGTVRVLGHDPAEAPAAVLGNVGYLAEEDWLPGWMRVSELQRYCQGFYPKWDQTFAEDLRQRFSLDRRGRLREMSKGQRARAGLMAALAHRPELLVLDEPSAGLDPIVRREILKSIIRSVADENRTVLLSSHLLNEVETVADEVAMIRQGEILFCDTLEGIKRSHRRLTVCFGSTRSHPPVIAETSHWTGGGAEWTCVYAGSMPAIEGAAALIGAEVVDEQWLTLDEIFVLRSEADGHPSPKEGAVA